MNTEQLNDNVSSKDTDNSNNFRLDYTLKTCEERLAYVAEMLNRLPPEKKNNSNYLENLSNYIINGMRKSERRNRKILTDNRKVTIDKREMSFEGILDKLEYEDNIYTMINENKQALLVPKISITKKDLEEIPDLAALRKEIEKIEELEKTARGAKKYALKKWLIEMRQDQYIIKDGYRKPTKFKKITNNIVNEVEHFDEEVTLTLDKRVESDGAISLYDPQHISLLLHFYSELKQEGWGHFENDLWYLMEDLDNLIERALPEQYPLLYDLLIMKIDGLSNIEISAEINKRFGKKYTNEYISSLWRRKIPKLIAEAAEQEYLDWYYTVKEKGKWKRCSRCGQIKLAHNFYFSKNKSSKDGFYSICKCCRNAKNRAKRIEGEK